MVIGADVRLALFGGMSVFEFSDGMNEPFCH